MLVLAMREAFCEDLAHEAAPDTGARLVQVDDLPPKLVRHISRDLKAEKRELSAWKLVGDDWRSLILDRVSEIARQTTFNTPKAAQIDELFDRSIGLTKVNDSRVPPRLGEMSARVALSEAISRRGGIAHGVTLMVKITNSQLSTFYQLTAPTWPSAPRPQSGPSSQIAPVSTRGSIKA